MELHSYAKRRTSKKWTIEQKRKLVEARIAHDAWFTNKPSSVVPWKNILVAANLDDFNVFFVRKQWSTMLTRYKQYKQTRLGNMATKPIDAESIRRINQEWEFFEPIHNFMTRKTTNLHSYALTHRSSDNNNEQQQQHGEIVQSSLNTEDQNHTKSPSKLQNETVLINLQDCVKENIPNNATIVLQTTIDNNNMSNDDGIHLFSSDTNEDFQTITGETTRKIYEAVVEDDYKNMNCVRNTDHDFYSKRSSKGAAESVENETIVKIHEAELQEQQINYFADASEESQESIGMIVDLNLNHHASSSLTPLNMVTVTDENGQEFDIKTENITPSEIENLKKEYNDEMPTTSTQRNLTQLSENNIPTSSTSRLTERDKYYRHKRRFNRRLEKRFDAILQVVGQIVKAEYPSIDVTPLVGTVNSVASTMGKLFNSESEEEDNDHSEDDNHSEPTDNIPSTTNNIQK